jgi:hypothetical protein
MAASGAEAREAHFTPPALGSRLFQSTPPPRFLALYKDDWGTGLTRDAQMARCMQHWGLFNLLSSCDFHPLLLDTVSNTQHAKFEHLA